MKREHRIYVIKRQIPADKVETTSTTKQYMHSLQNNATNKRHLLAYKAGTNNFKYNKEYSSIQSGKSQANMKNGISPLQSETSDKHEFNKLYSFLATERYLLAYKAEPLTNMSNKINSSRNLHAKTVSPRCKAESPRYKATFPRYKAVSPRLQSGKPPTNIQQNKFLATKRYLLACQTEKPNKHDNIRR